MHKFRTHFAKIAFGAIAFALLGPMSTLALAESADSLMSKRRAYSSGWDKSETIITMKIYDRNGKSVQRKLKQYAIEVPNNGNRTINLFSQPVDVKGLAVLTHSGLTGNDKQWLYLPSNKRVKRISTSNRSGAFIGSEFAYEDLSSFEVQKYKYIGAKDGTYKGKPVYIVDFVPIYSKSGYSKVISYLDKKHYQPLKQDYFNKRGELYKTLILSGFKSYTSSGGWRPHKMEMINHINGKRTTLDFGAYRATKANSATFNSNRLNKVR
jgi:hypothetical protein